MSGPGRGSKGDSELRAKGRKRRAEERQRAAARSRGQAGGVPPDLPPAVITPLYLLSAVFGTGLALGGGYVLSRLTIATASQSGTMPGGAAEFGLVAMLTLIAFLSGMFNTTALYASKRSYERRRDGAGAAGAGDGAIARRQAALAASVPLSAGFLFVVLLAVFAGILVNTAGLWVIALPLAGLWGGLAAIGSYLTVLYAEEEARG